MAKEAKIANGKKRKSQHCRKIGDVARAIDGTGGNVSAICKSLNISRRTFYAWLKEWDEVRLIYEDEKESMLDFAEEALHSLIGDGNLGAVCFYLKCQGKTRGYVEKQDPVQSIEHTNIIHSIVEALRK